MLEKRYHPAQYEAQIYRKWEQSGAFKPSEVADGREAYTIVIPPPNITGNLHMGHALNNMVQDVLIRSKRMQGYDVLWQPGIDHASIATQMVVERQLAEQGLPDRRSMGREAFLERVWQWKAISGGRIADQLRRLGASCDWSRERFTMDAMLGRAVVEMFVRLHEQGLIYRAKRMLNWDPKMETAISDLEVVQREVQGTLWRFAYPIKDDREGARIPVATTRPETMLGDVAVAVNPHDPRYLHLIGRSCVQPVTGRELIIIADDHADPEAGTGAVKITPAHDFNDFEVGKRHGLELVEIFDHHACLNENVPPAYQGLDRMKARTKIIADMQALGAFLGEDAITHSVPYGERGGVPVEPMVTDQWFVDCTSLAARAIESVKAGRTEFVPVGWDQNFFNWLEQIEPWCISRQLWWGHQIPAWYGPDGQVFVGRDLAEAAKKAEAAYGEKVKLVRDPDVLDTWFSSALWPFSTQGWPDKTEDFRRFYPTSVLVTGFDIIFFWVARMMMAGLHLTDREPFHTVYVHALVRDEHGQKMSKSKGNVIDPLSVIDRYGADALRMTLCALAAPGRDMRLSVDRVA
ncbi:MAG: valine--tRNA ligase, partial [Pseudomonadota bacterium]